VHASELLGLIQESIQYLHSSLRTEALGAIARLRHSNQNSKPGDWQITPLNQRPSCLRDLRRRLESLHIRGINHAVLWCGLDVDIERISIDEGRDRLKQFLRANLISQRVLPVLSKFKQERCAISAELASSPPCSLIHNERA
jgi:hypothetical protein